MMIASFALALACLSMPRTDTVAGHRNFYQPPPPAKLDEPTDLRYGFRSGDHLVYRQILERTVDGRKLYGLRNPPSKPFGDRGERLTRAEWTVHLIVPAAAAGRTVVGTQRNRSMAQLVRSRVRGKDRTSEERSLFDDRHRQTWVTAQGTLVSELGALLLPPEVIREWPSKVLWAVSEIAPLPAVPVRPGDRWTTPNPLGFAFRAAKWEEVAGERCLDIRGEALADLLIPRTDAPDPVFHLRYWFCPTSGVVRRLEFTGEYPNALFEKVTERLTLELAEARRGESPDLWLADSLVREALVEAWLVSDSLVIAPAALERLLAGAPDRLARRVLALAYRRGLSLPAAALMGWLGSSDPRVRVLATRLSVRLDPVTARRLLERAAADSDPFVREAAREPAAPDLVGPQSSDSSSERCGVDSAWTAARMHDGVRPAEPPRTVLRGMTAADRRGWPYVVRVPEDYRGERPLPLIVYLAGNAGSAIEGVLLAHDGLDRTGYLVVYPHSADWWWHDGTTAMMSTLIEEVQREYRVDASRIFLTGLSNGGTGALYFASLWPDRFTAMVSAMGAGTTLATLPANTATLPVAFLHGEQDPVIPPAASRRVMTELGPRRAPADTHFFRDRAHEIVVGSGDDGRTLAFFERFRRQAPPRYVRLQTRNLGHTRRQHWVEIVERDSATAPQGAEGEDAQRLLASLIAGDTVSVVGEISPANEITLRTDRVRKLRLLLRRDLLAPGKPVRVVVNGREVFAGSVPPDCAARERSVGETADPFRAYDAELVITVPSDG